MVAAMKSFSRLLPIVAAASLGFSLDAASNTDDGVVARVNQKTITEADMRFAEVEIMTQLVRLPADRRRQATLDYLIDGQLFAEAAEQSKLDRQAGFEARRNYYLRRALRDAYFDDQIRNRITEEDLRRAYDDQLANVKAPTEYRVRQILSGSEAEARDLRLKLVSGSDFAALAQQASRDLATAQNGGDMGYVLPSQLDPDFEKAVVSLPVGELSAPIKTRVGWAVARVDDRRVRPLPTFEDAKELLRLELLATRTREAVASLRGRAAIIYTNPEDAIGK
jgi:peptidyl-prolyl cis-trans isomerase C